MINCAHLTQFTDVLVGEPWAERIRAIRANSSKMSHAELDNAEKLDEGKPQEFGQEYLMIRAKLPNLNILSGCCGTAHRHVESVCQSWLTDDNEIFGGHD